MQPESARFVMNNNQTNDKNNSSPIILRKLWQVVAPTNFPAYPEDGTHIEDGNMRRFFHFTAAENFLIICAWVCVHCVYAGN